MAHEPTEVQQAAGPPARRSHGAALRSRAAVAGRRARLPQLALAAVVLTASMPLAHAVGAVGGGRGETAQAAVVLPPAPRPMGPQPMQVDPLEKKRWLLAAVERLEEARSAAVLMAASQKGLAIGARGGSRSRVRPGTDRMAAIPTTSGGPKSRLILALVRKHFPASQVGNAMAVAACESGHSDAVGAVNSDGTRDWGVFQLNDGGTLQGALSAIGVDFASVQEAQERALDTATNVRAAARIYADRGWAPWVCAYKIGVVSSLYGNAPGPTYGKFDQWGKPTVPVPVVDIGPAGGADAQHPGDDAAKRPARAKKAADGGGPDPEPAGTAAAEPPRGTPATKRVPSAQPAKKGATSPAAEPVAEPEVDGPAAPSGLPQSPRPTPSAPAQSAPVAPSTAAAVPSESAAEQAPATDTQVPAEPTG